MPASGLRPHFQSSFVFSIRWVRNAPVGVWLNTLCQGEEIDILQQTILGSDNLKLCFNICTSGPCLVCVPFCMPLWWDPAYFTSSSRPFCVVSLLPHFALISLVIFAELCTLLCYQVFVLKFRYRVSLTVSNLNFFAPLRLSKRMSINPKPVKKIYWKVNNFTVH